MCWFLLLKAWQFKKYYLCSNLLDILLAYFNLPKRLVIWNRQVVITVQNVNPNTTEGDDDEDNEAESFETPCL